MCENTNIKLEKENPFSILFWVSIFVFFIMGFGWLSFLGPILVYVCFPEEKRTNIFEKHYASSLNFSLTLLVLSAIALFFFIVGTLGFFIFAWDEILAFIWFILCSIYWLSILAFTCYYFIVVIIQMVKASNNEKPIFSLTIPFFKR